MKATTYDKSRGAAACDAPIVCAKLVIAVLTDLVFPNPLAGNPAPNAQLPPLAAIGLQYL